MLRRAASRAAAGCMRKARREIVTPCKRNHDWEGALAYGACLHRSRRMTGFAPDTLHTPMCRFKISASSACGGVTRKRELAPLRAASPDE